VLEEGGGAGEGAAGLGHQVGDQAPDQVAQRQEGQVLGDRHVEQRAVDHPQRQDQDGHAEGHPERPDHRAAIALADVGPAERGPQPPAEQPVADVAPGERPARRAPRVGGMALEHQQPGGQHRTIRLRSRSRATRGAGKLEGGGAAGKPHGPPCGAAAGPAGPSVRLRLDSRAHGRYHVSEALELVPGSA
jgi:hypothetical protein